MELKFVVEKHSGLITRIIAAVVLAVLASALVLVFRGGLLPRSSDGDAFDTVYLLESSTDVPVA